MSNIVGENIYTLRKNRGLTQEKLAELVNVSFQAVSKWENGNSVPDVSVLPLLANALHCSIDFLLGYVSKQRLITDYEERYKTDGYYWGTRPSYMCYEVLKLRPPVKPLRLPDIACGEGKDAVFFARNGYSVTAFDAAQTGLEKAERLAAQTGVGVNFFQADMPDFRPANLTFSSAQARCITSRRSCAVNGLRVTKSIRPPTGCMPSTSLCRSPFWPIRPTWKKTGTNGFPASC